MASTRPIYRITKLFTGGALKGLTVTEESAVFLPVGFKSRKGIGSPYRVIAPEKR